MIIFNIKFQHLINNMTIILEGLFDENIFNLTNKK